MVDRTRVKGKGKEKQEEEEMKEKSSEREHTHYLNVRHSVRSVQPSISMREATVILLLLFLPLPSFLPFLVISLSLFSIFSVRFTVSIFRCAKCGISRVLSNDCQVDNLRLVAVFGLDENRRHRPDSSREMSVFKRNG